MALKAITSATALPAIRKVADDFARHVSEVGPLSTTPALSEEINRIHSYLAEESLDVDVILQPDLESWLLASAQFLEQEIDLDELTAMVAARGTFEKPKAGGTPALRLHFVSPSDEKLSRE